MKQNRNLFLKGVVLLLALAVLAICVVLLPMAISTDRTGYYQPILLGLYVAAIPFFTALYQAWKLLSYIETNKAFSDLSVKALRIIKFCGAAISLMFMAGMPYIFYAADRDDAPGVVLIGLIIIFASLVIATFAGLLQKLLREALDIKKENELTI